MYDCDCSFYPRLGIRTDRRCSSVFISVNPLTSNIKEQILPSCPVTFLIKVLWGSY